MSTSKQLRQNLKQHTPKNIQSKMDEKNVLEAMNRVIIYLNERLDLNKKGYYLEREGYAPVSMYFREKNWETNELYEIMKEVAETSIRNYIF